MENEIAEKKPRKRIYISLLLAVIIGLFFVIFNWNYIGESLDGVAGQTSGEAIGTGIATMIVLPHMICLTAAFAFSCIGLLFRQAWGALVAGILYAVAIALMVMWFYDSVAQVVLCFFAYGRMRKHAG